MFRTPLPNAELSKLERCGSRTLLDMFASAPRTGPGKGYGRLPVAWGALFADLFLSAEELIDEIPAGKHRLGADNEQMLREFIRADCARGGAFVLSVIKTGGKIDRAALILIAELEDIAGIRHQGTTGIHLLIDSCDKKVRPVLIRKAGKRLLAGIYDRRGIPAIFTIFGLGDVNRQDLDAIAAVFSEDELAAVMVQSRTGKNALVVFREISLSLEDHASLDRNTFFRTNATKVAVPEGDAAAGVIPPVHDEKRAALPDEEGNRNGEPGSGEPGSGSPGSA